MAMGISGYGITGTLGDGNVGVDTSLMQKEANRFADLVKESQRQQALALASSSASDTHIGTGVSSSQISRNHRLNGDYTMGFAGTYTSQADKSSAPRGFAMGAKNKDGSNATIDRTSELYEQSMELENYMVKMMMSSMRNSITHTSLAEGNDYARKMYDDMMYDNMAEAMTKNAGFGLADKIYLELSGQR